MKSTVNSNGKYPAERITNYLNKVKNSYFFEFCGTKVKIVFSKDPAAQTIENALVKIAMRNNG